MVIATRKREAVIAVRDFPCDAGRYQSKELAKGLMIKMGVFSTKRKRRWKRLATAGGLVQSRCLDRQGSPVLLIQSWSHIGWYQRIPTHSVRPAYAPCHLVTLLPVQRRESGAGACACHDGAPIFNHEKIASRRSSVLARYLLRCATLISVMRLNHGGAHYSRIEHTGGTSTSRE